MKKKVPATRSRKRKAQKSRIKELLLKLSPRQLEYRKYRLSGLNIYASAKAAGYSESYSRGYASVKLARTVQDSITVELDLAGATNRFQAEQLMRIASSAMKMQSCTVEVMVDDEGEVHLDLQPRVVQIPDEAVRLKAIEVIAKIKKQIVTSMAALVPDSGFTRLSLIIERDKDHEDNSKSGNDDDKKASDRPSLVNEW